MKEVPLIQDFNLKVEPGQRIAIVGPTGCGKTTLINLLMRFYDVNVGMIKVEGNDIRDVTRESLRSSYGMVLQETWLKAGTIRENICYGKPDATEEEMIMQQKKPMHMDFNRANTQMVLWIRSLQKVAEISLKDRNSSFVLQGSC